MRADALKTHDFKCNLHFHQSYAYGNLQFKLEDVRLV